MPKDSCVTQEVLESTQLQQLHTQWVFQEEPCAHACSPCHLSFDNEYKNTFYRPIIFHIWTLTIKKWSTGQNNLLCPLPSTVHRSSTFLLDREWPWMTLNLGGQKPERWGYQEEITISHLWLWVILICCLQRKPTAIMSLFPASAIKGWKGKWREIRAGEGTENWIVQSIVVKLFIFLCQDKREINRRYWCWAQGSLVSFLLCHFSNCL